MKVVCTKKNLSAGLNIATKIISVGTTLPILNNILLSTDKGRVKLSSTNLEIAINTWVGGKVEIDGEITIPARLISDFINNLPAEKIILSSEKTRLLIEAEQVKTHINGLSPDEFPLIPKISDPAFSSIKTKDFKKAVNEVVYSTAFSESQPEISGVLFNFKDKNLILAATDRYRLAERTIALNNETSKEIKLIVPAKAVSEMARVLDGENVDIFISEGQAMFKSDNTELTTRLIEGQYPDYQQIIPKNYLTSVLLNRADLISGIKAVSIFTTENNNIEIEINPQNKKVALRSQSAAAGDSEIYLGGEFSGQINTIIFNYRYLLECLGALDDEEVELQTVDTSSPAQIKPRGRENFLYIVMPIKI